MEPVRPDAGGRVGGTTYPAGVAPEGARRLGERVLTRRQTAARWLLRFFAEASLEILRPTPGDVLVLRGDAPGAVVEALNLSAARRRLGPVIVLPRDVRVHVEPPRLKREDRGYRETRVYGTDRGVNVGVPGKPVTPHPLSEAGEDPCAPS